MATLKKDNDIISLNNENVISAFLNNGYEVVEEIPQPQPMPIKKETVKKATTKKKIEK